MSLLCGSCLYFAEVQDDPQVSRDYTDLLDSIVEVHAIICARFFREIACVGRVK